MGLWSWATRVLTDTGGGVKPVSIGLERNPGAVIALGAENPEDVPLYVLRLGLRSGFGRTEAGLPVYRRKNESPHPILKEIYFCEVAGSTLEAANVYALRQKVQRTLETIAPSRALPLCYFIAPRFDYSLPVYEEGSKLVCPILVGPKIKAGDLSALRDPVTRYLRSGGYLADDERPHIQVVRPSDLRLVLPAAVLQSLDDEELWLPTVEGVSSEGPVIGLLAHPAELEESERRRVGPDAPDAPPSAPDVTGLLRYIGGEMARRGHVVNPWALYASHVRPEIWARTEELTDATPRSLECYLEEADEGSTELSLPIRHTAAGEVVAAIQEHAITVFLAGDDDALAGAVGRYLQRTGFLRHADDLRVETARARPADHLDPDDIWTGEREAEGVAAGQELSITTDRPNEDQEVSTQ